MCRRVEAGFGVTVHLTVANRCGLIKVSLITATIDEEVLGAEFRFRIKYLGEGTLLF